MAARKLEIVIAGDSSGFGRSLDEASDKAGRWASGLAKTLGAAMAATGAAAGAALVTGVVTAVGQEASSDKLAARLALSPEQAERLGSIAGDIYAGAWGESFDEVNVALEGTLKAFGDGMSDADLTGVTTQALDIASAFDLDVSEALRAASSLFKNDLVSDAGEAMDVLTLGLQGAGQDSGDLLDSLNEYAEQFASLGLDGQTATQMLIAGFDAGAFSVDKVGDAVKEFSVRAIDGSDATSKAFEGLGFDADNMAERIAAGGPTARDAMGEVITALSGVGDAVKQDEMGVALFGTMWEDIGPEAIAAINPMNQELVDIGSRAEDLGATLNDNLGTKLETIKRTVLQALADFVEDKLLPALTRIADFGVTLAEKWRTSGMGDVF